MKKNLNNVKTKPASVLLLTVVIVGLLTTMALGSAVIRFDQLTITDRINNSAVAKASAESGIQFLQNQDANYLSGLSTVGHDLTKSQNLSVTDLNTFKPSPSHSTYAIGKGSGGLSRCSAVGVLSPWVNNGYYIYSSDVSSSNNPALIFQWMNIANNTQLRNINSNPSDTSTIGSNTKEGNFYNPYAPAGTSPDQPSYWTIKMGGPYDDFLSKLGPDRKSSFYNNLDLIYIPYLPKFEDSGLKDSSNIINQVSAAYLQRKLGTIIQNNNMKVWLDAAVSDDLLYKYGLGDLYKDDVNNQISWIQPRLWNDNPEVDANSSGIYTTDNIDGGSWTKNSMQPAVFNSDSGWYGSILKASQLSGFVVTDNITGSGNSYTIVGSYYGPMTGIKLSKFVDLSFVSNNTPEKTVQGYISNIVTQTSGSNQISFAVSADLSAYPINTANPTRVLSISGNPYATSNIGLFSSFTLNTASGTPTVTSNYTGCSSTKDCVAVGDMVNFYKNDQTTPPVWGIVKTVTFNGTTSGVFTVDAFRNWPKPLRDFASVKYNSNGTDYLAVYGGSIIENYYPGGTNSESNDFWVYNITTKTWTYKKTNIPKLAGASMSYDGNYFIITGGYSHLGSSCTINPCSNKVGTRWAQRLNNSTYAVNVNDFTVSGNSPSGNTIALNDQVSLKVLSSLPERSGIKSDIWQISAADTTITTNFTNFPITLTGTNPTVGFSTNDIVDISGTISGGASNGNTINFSGRIKGLNNTTPSMTVDLIGLTINANISLTNIKITQASRNFGSSLSCTWSGTSCLSPSAPDGLSVGDLVALDKMSGTQLTNQFYGYISGINGNNITFSLDENNDSFGQTNTPLSWPTPRFGHYSSYTTANNLNKTILWGGSNGEKETHLHPTEVWQGNYNGSSIVWNMVAMDLGSADIHQQVKGKVISYPKTAIFDASIPKSTMYNCATNNISCNLNINTKNIVTNSQLTFESTKNDGSKWQYKGVVSDVGADYITVNIDFNPTAINLDQTGDPWNVKISVGYPYNNDQYYYPNFNSSYYGRNGSSEVAVGSVVVLDDGRTVQITDRTYENYTSYIYGYSVKAPLSIANGTNVLSTTSPASPAVYQPLSYSNYYFKDKTNMPPIVYPSTLEISDKVQAEWRFNGTGWSIKDTFGASIFTDNNWKQVDHPYGLGSVDPAPRQGGEVAASGNEVIMTGGTKGSYSSVFRQKNINSTDTCDSYHPNSCSRWLQLTSSTNSGSDLPNLFGGSLSIKSDGAGAVFFGGEIKTDNNPEGYNNVIGPKIRSLSTYEQVNGSGSYSSDKKIFMASSDATNSESTNLVNDLYNQLPDQNIIKTPFKIDQKGNERGSIVGLATWYSNTPKTQNGLLLGSTRSGNKCYYDYQNSNNNYTTCYPNIETNDYMSKNNFYLGVINPGNGFKIDSSNNPTMILSGPQKYYPMVSGNRTDQEGYYPYINNEYKNSISDTDTSINNYIQSDKTIMFAGYNKMTQGGYLLVTPAGIGNGLINDWVTTTTSTSNPGGRFTLKYSIGCNLTYNDSYQNCPNGDLGVHYLDWIPDSEDLAFAMNATRYLTDKDTYTVIGYYGGVKRAFIVNINLVGTTSKVFKLQETTP